MVAIAIGGVVVVATIAYCMHRLLQRQKNEEITENMKVQQDVNEGHPEIAKPENYVTDLENAVSHIIMFHFLNEVIPAK